MLGRVAGWMLRLLAPKALLLSTCGWMDGWMVGYTTILVRTWMGLGEKSVWCKSADRQTNRQTGKHVAICVSVCLATAYGRCMLYSFGSSKDLYLCMYVCSMLEPACSLPWLTN